MEMAEGKGASEGAGEGEGEGVGEGEVSERVRCRCIGSPINTHHNESVRCRLCVPSAAMASLASSNVFPL